ncbi:MAG TPA: TetR/AcrR family transcriptional regulator [Myxococcota bacterium]|nr:TetR/AcrR family transcriptional regulator [Myxococcota bacterium]
MPRAAPERRDRRALVARALYHCISERGYANTSLKDIADRAGMSPSHVGYYFDNKPAILEYYAASICARNLRELPDAGEPELGKLIDRIADFCLGEGQMSGGLLKVIQELTGLAVHDERLHEIKAQHAEGWRRYLEGVFERAGPAPGLSAREAAWLAHAMIVGLNTNALFDGELRREDAHRILRLALRSLAGLEPSAPPARRRPPGPRPARTRGTSR